jgi:hemolysin D
MKKMLNKLRPKKILDSSIKNLRYLKVLKYKKYISLYKKFIDKSKEKFSHQKLINFIALPKRLLEVSQDALERRVNSETEEVLLKQSPFLARSITWTLVGGTAFGLVWLGLAKTEEIVISQGKLEPISKVIDVQMPIGGIIKQLNIEEGQLVKKGDLLINLDTDITEKRVENGEKLLEINNEILGKLQLLLDEGAISQLQYFEQITKINEIETSLLEQKVNLKYHKILSPIDGKIFELKPKGEGFVARSSEPILKIVPQDSLVAKVEINSNKIGFVSLGKKVDISIDSFPASDFGVIEGVLETISSDALPPDPSQNKGYRYKANIKLSTQYLELKNGQKLSLQPGMSLTANIKLRKVSYLQLILSSLNQKTDSLKEI